MSDWDNDWMYFTKRTRKGLFVLLLLFVIVAITPRVYYTYFYEFPEYNVQVELMEEDSFIKEKQLTNLQIKKQEKKRYTLPETPFNPNDYNLEDWMRIGLSEKQANSVLKFIGSGHGLKIKSDLKKIYVIDEELYSLLYPLLELPEKLESQEYTTNKFNSSKEKENLLYENNQTNLNTYPKSESTPLSLNSASEKELQTIHGVGPFFAKEIVKLREQFGGFRTHEQLLVIYNMDEEKLKRLKPYLLIDERQIKKININIASEEELKKHPYISNQMAKSIVYYRMNYKKYNRVDELLLSPFIDRETLEKLKHYVKVE